MFNSDLFNRSLTTINIIQNGEKAIFLKATDVSENLGYEDKDQAIRKHVSEKYKIKLSEIYTRQNDRFINPVSMHPNTIFLKEPGFYEAVFCIKITTSY